MNTTKKNGPFSSMFIGIIFILVAFFMNKFIVSEAREMGKESINWPYTQGIVVKSEIKSHYSKNSDGKSKKMYTPSVEVKYNINGQDLLTSMINTSGTNTSYSSRNKARNTTTKYSQGKLVNVYYDPTDFQYAILETGIPSSTNMMYYGLIVFMIVGAGLLISGFIKVLLLSTAILFGIKAIFGKKNKQYNTTNTRPRPRPIPTTNPNTEIKKSVNIPENSNENKNDDNDDAFDI